MYKREIVSAIVELKEPRGSSSVSIKELVQDNLPADKSFHNASFMRALKKAVDDGDVVKSANNSYKLSSGLRRNLKEAAAETYKTKPEPEAYKGLRADGDLSLKNKDGTRFLAAPKKGDTFRSCVTACLDGGGDKEKCGKSCALQAKKPAAPKKKTAPKKKATKKIAVFP